MLDPNQFTKHIIRPALEAIDLYSKAAEELLLGTAIQESRLVYLKQIGGGPALGLFQMEPATHDDIWDNYLDYKDTLFDKVYVLACRQPVDPHDMIWNLYYAAAMCRIHYYRVPEALPEAGDYEGMAKYHKQYYNTPLGSTKLSESIEVFKDVMERKLVR